MMTMMMMMMMMMNMMNSVMFQRQQLRSVPVSECSYSWDNLDGQFWVYGKEMAVYAPDYPQKYCWGCVVL